MAITLKDVAKVAGVSYVTVSNVINRRGYVSSNVKERVLKSVLELNYTPNESARIRATKYSSEEIGGKKLTA